MHTPRTANQGISLGRAALWLGLAIWTMSLLRTPLPAARRLIHPPDQSGVSRSRPHRLRAVRQLHDVTRRQPAPGDRAARVRLGFLFQQDDPFGASVCVWWAGESLLDLAPYIDDARSLQLMLLGGPAAEVEGHDWEAILMALGWLHLDHTIANGAWYLRRCLDARRAGLFVFPASFFVRVERMNCRLESMENYRVPAGTGIGHVHLKVSDIDRALAFYTRCPRVRSDHAARRPARPLYRPVAIITTSASIPGRAGADSPLLPTTRASTISRFAIRRGAIWRDAVRRVIDAGVPIQGVADHGVSESIYLADLDGNGIELTRDRPESEWPRDAEGNIALAMADPLDLEALLREALIEQRAESKEFRLCLALCSVEIMRIGIDLGGTKIEAIAIDGAHELLRRRVSAPRGDYAATVTAVRDLVAAIERELGDHVHRRHRHSRRHLRCHRTGQERELDLADWPAAGSRSRARARTARARGERRELFCAVGSHRRRRAGRAHRVRRHSRHGHRRRHCRERPRARRTPSHRRRMGTQSAALAAGRRASGSAVLLRAHGLHRNVSVGTRALGHVRRDRRAPRRGRGHRGAGRSGRPRRESARSPSTKRGSRGRSRVSSMCSIRTSSSSAAACPISPGCTPGFRRC